MIMLRVYDRVRLLSSTAMDHPDRRDIVGTVVGTWVDPAGIQRVDVAFDGEYNPVPGYAASSYELTE